VAATPKQKDAARANSQKQRDMWAQFKAWRAGDREAAPEGVPAQDVPPKGRGAGVGPSIRRAVQDLVQTLNGIAMLVPWTAADALDEREVELLSNGLDRAQMVDPRLRRMLTMAERANGYGALIFAGLVIALPRLNRRGILGGRPMTPEEYARWSGMLDGMAARMREEEAAADAAEAPAGPEPIHYSEFGRQPPEAGVNGAQTVAAG